MGKVGKALWDMIKKDKAPEELLKEYWDENYGASRFKFNKVKDELRFQHTFYVGGSGCGKSTFMQGFLVEELKRVKQGKASLIFIDPVQANDFILKHAGLENFKNAILIDMADPDSLPCLDIFETTPVEDERLRVANLTGVFSNVCEGLLDQKMTEHMKTLFKYSARVIVRMERPDLRKFLQLLLDPMAVMEALDFGPGDTEYDFFRDEVVGNGKGRTPMKETATGLRTRIHGVLSDPLIERLFCAGEPTLSIGQAINDGSAIFVATRKGRLSAEGARLLGNYILTLVHRTMQQRVEVDPDQMMPTFLYYDEVQNAFNGGYNEVLCDMLDEDRKYKLSVNIATTRFGHINTDMCDAILSCCETKIVGKMSQRGAGMIAVELFGRDPEGVTKLTGIPNYQFYCRVKSEHETAFKVKCGKDPITKMGKPNPRAMKKFRERMTLKYGAGRIAVEQEVKERTLPPEISSPAQKNPVNDPLKLVGAV